jgi:hypothetical protein
MVSTQPNVERLKMDLLCGYGSDGSSGEKESVGPDPTAKEEEKIFASAPAAKKRKEGKPSLLPSAADLFSSVKEASFLRASAPVEAPEIVPMKKNQTTLYSAQNVEDSEKLKAASRAVLLPPQLSRGANVITEDVSKWSSKQQTKPMEKSKASFNSKEKRKRQEGKVAREGSFVEEEKRLLRQGGTD